MVAVVPSELKRQSLPFIKDHFGSISQREIARRLKIGKTTINTWAKELGLVFKKNTVNEYFFDTFDESSSYILGLIFADGCVSWNPEKGYYNLTITASEKDKDHLEVIRELMSSTKPLLYSPGTNSYRLIVNSKNLCLKLMSLGVIPRKTLTAEFPEISSLQMKHFLRGVIDGDGHIRHVERRRSPYFEISISSGSEKFCEGLVASIEKNVGVKTIPRKIGNRCYIMQYSCSRGEKLANYIYSGATIYLNRKHSVYKKFINGGKLK